jgi:hypothetical protein
MLSLDLFDSRYERQLREGAVDDLEARRIDDLNMRMLELLDRAKEPAYRKNPGALAGLKQQFQKIKAERDSYFKINPATGMNADQTLGTTKGRLDDGQVTPTATGLRHHARPENYGGYEPEADSLAKLDKSGTNKLEKAMGVKFDREKKYQGGLDVDEAGIPGNIPTEKIPGKEDLLKGKGRSYYEDQKKNSDEVDEHGGGIGPRQHWQDLMQERKLSVGDPIIVTGPNEFEGKTGEVAEFSPSGKFVVVNLYNHGEHSMHLSDIAYNEYADQEDEDDWYDKGVAEAIVASGPSRPLDDRAVRKMVWDTMKINADTGEQAIQRALAVLAKKPQSRMVQDLQDKFQSLADRLAQGVAEEQKPGFGEFPPKQEITIVPPKKLKSGQTYQDRNKYWQSQGQAPIYKTNEDNDPRAGMARIYRRLAPKIERYRDSFLAGQLYDELENYAELHGAEREFKQMMNGARNRAHMEYDTNPGGFHNWFWFLPFEDEGVEEGWSDAMVARRTGTPRTPYSVFIKGRKWKDFENDDHAEAVANKLRAKFKADGRDPSVITVAPTDMSEAKATKTRLDPKCWTGKKIGNPKTKVKGGVRVNNCVPAESVNEDQDTSGVEQAILKRIMVAHLDLLRQYGPDKVMQAAEEVAYNVGDVDEIGTSDVSSWVKQVQQILGAV